MPPVVEVVIEHLPIQYVVSVVSMNTLSLNVIPTPPFERAVVDLIKPIMLL
jgi:hypothetical protein